MRTALLLTLFAPFRLCGGPTPLPFVIEDTARFGPGDTGGARPEEVQIVVNRPGPDQTWEPGQDVQLVGTINYPGVALEDLVSDWTFGAYTFCEQRLGPSPSNICDFHVPDTATGTYTLVFRVRTPWDDVVTATQDVDIRTPITGVPSLVLSTPSPSSSWQAGSPVPFVVQLTGVAPLDGVRVQWTVDGAPDSALSSTTNRDGIASVARLVAAGPHEAEASATIEDTTLTLRTRFTVE